jgi:hypothetical protein
MKQILKFSLVVVLMFSAMGLAQSQTLCSITCNISQAYVCPKSNQWKNNPELYGDEETMKDIGYSKDKDGCWVLKGSSTYQKSGDKSSMTKIYDKLSRFFGKNNVKKTGF